MATKPTFTGRQLLSQLADTARPLVIVNDAFEVVFANEIAAQSLCVPVSTLQGYVLEKSIQSASKSTQQDLYVAQLQSWYESVRSLKNGECSIIRTTTSAGVVDWLVIGFCVGKRQLTFFVGLSKDDPLLKSLNSTLAWAADQALVDYWQQLSHQQYDLRKHLGLVGPNLRTKLAMQQTQLALSGNAPVLIVGAAGTGCKDLAELILHQRKHPKDMTNPPTVISCGLVDVKLLQELRELVLEKIHHAKKLSAPLPSVLLHRLDLLADECISEMKQLLTGMSDFSVVATIQSDSQELVNQTKLAEIVAQLSVIRIDLPELSDRHDDIPILCRTIIHRHVQDSDLSLEVTIHDEAMRAFLAYSWPKNVDELISTLGYAIKNSKGPEIRIEHLPLSIRSYPSSILEQTDAPMGLEESLEKLERSMIELALVKHAGNRARAAKMLKISRTKLARRIEQLKIDSPKELPIASPMNPTREPKSETQSSSKQRPKKMLSNQELIELTTEEFDEEPIFREIEEE